MKRLTISEAIEIAERQTADAQHAIEAGEPDGKDRVQQWSDTLYVLRVMEQRGVPDSMKDE